MALDSRGAVSRQVLPGLVERIVSRFRQECVKRAAKEMAFSAKVKCTISPEQMSWQVKGLFADPELCEEARLAIDAKLQQLGLIHHEVKLDGRKFRLSMDVVSCSLDDPAIGFVEVDISGSWPRTLEPQADGATLATAETQPSATPEPSTAPQPKTAPQPTTALGEGAIDSNTHGVANGGANVDAAKAAGWVAYPNGASDDESDAASWVSS